MQPLFYYSYYFAPEWLFWEESKTKCLLKFWPRVLSHLYCTTACFFFFPHPEPINWHFFKCLFQGLAQLLLTINMLSPKELCLKAPVLFSHFFFSPLSFSFSCSPPHHSLWTLAYSRFPFWGNYFRAVCQEHTFTAFFISFNFIFQVLLTGLIWRNSMRVSSTSKSLTVSDQRVYQRSESLTWYLKASKGQGCSTTHGHLGSSALSSCWEPALVSRQWPVHTAMLLSRPLLRPPFLQTDASSGPSVSHSEVRCGLKYISRELNVLKAWNFSKGMQRIKGYPFEIQKVA